MDSGPASPIKTEDLINAQELTAYRHFTSFNLFIYSRINTNVPVFLLYQADGSSVFTHFSGTFTKHDPNIFFSVVREFVTQTRGLLYPRNFEYFRAESANPCAPDEIMLEEDLSGPVRP